MLALYTSILHVLVVKTWSSENITNTKEALVNTVHRHCSKNLSSQSDREHCVNASFQQWHAVASPKVQTSQQQQFSSSTYKNKLKLNVINLKKNAVFYTPMS